MKVQLNIKPHDDNRFMHKRETVLIEFVGLPGAGKSTITEEIKQITCDDQICVKVPILETINKKGKYEKYAVKMLNSIKTLLYHPIKSVKALNIIHSSNQNSMRDLVGLWIYFLFMHNMMEKSQNKGAIYLFDQGVYQFLWSIAISGNNVELPILRKIQDLFPTPKKHGIITICVSTDVSVNRLQKREGNYSRLEKYIDDDSIDEEEICERASRLVNTLKKEEVEMSENMYHYEINTTNKSVSQTAVELYEGIRRYAI